MVDARDPSNDILLLFTAGYGVRGLTYNMVAVSAREDAPRQNSLFFPFRPYPSFFFGHVSNHHLSSATCSNQHLASHSLPQLLMLVK